jgi:hypothetical protein
MEYTILELDPSAEPCEKCSQTEYDTLPAEDDEGELVYLCIACALEEDHSEQCESEVETTLKYELTEPDDYEEYENGWSTESAFGQFWVEFDTEDAKAQTQIAVDDFKTLGYYKKLKGQGQIHIEAPKQKDTGIYLTRNDNRKDHINEKRAEKAIER